MHIELTEKCSRKCWCTIFFQIIIIGYTIGVVNKGRHDKGFGGKNWYFHKRSKMSPWTKILWGKPPPWILINVSFVKQAFQKLPKDFQGVGTKTCFKTCVPQPQVILIMLVSWLSRFVRIHIFISENFIF